MDVTGFTWSVKNIINVFDFSDRYVARLVINRVVSISLKQVGSRT